MADQEQPPAPDKIVAQTAFIIYLDENGNWLANINPNAQMEVARAANTNDIFLGCAMVKRDMEAVHLIGGIMAAMQRQSAQFFDQAQLAGLANAVGAKGAVDLSRIQR